MTTSHLLLALVLGAASACAGPASTGDRSGARQLLPLADCLDPDRARSWALVDSDELLVDAGRKRYHIQLSISCPDIATAPSVVFRGGGGLGHLCGNATDAVIADTRARMTQPCPIAAITLLDEERYQQYLDGDEEFKPLGAAAD